MATSSLTALIAVVTVLTASSAIRLPGSNITCPPAGFDSVPDLDIFAYVSAPWYVQRQVPVGPQQSEDLFCVRAIYEPFIPGNASAGFRVLNYANKGKVNGPSKGTGSPVDKTFSMAAFPAALFQAPDSPSGLISKWLGAAETNNSTVGSKLVVGPEGVVREVLDGNLRWASALGPYWVVAVGNSTNATLKYDWAVVSGGPPSFESLSGETCTTFMPLLPAALQYRGGLWLFTRKPVDEVSGAAAESAARGLGIDTSGLMSVTQSGCNYT